VFSCEYLYLVDLGVRFERGDETTDTRRFLYESGEAESMPSISNKWTKTGSGFERDDESLSLGVYVTTADVHYHGDDVHVRPDAPKHAANAYQVYAVTDFDDPSARIPLVNYADLDDAVTFATLVTRYADHRGDVIAIEEIAEQEASHEDDWWPEGIVEGDEKPPREALRAMLGTYGEQLDDALSASS
jgi:hypothetical protein